ncbi:hypothetical protein [Bifidobacterium xylocopae]|uniref:hypothetical protein n=1 Tax=Bifidobacterium xylocopae TaxID=2493119 RepID=UPI001F3EC098|nr:hypothetical protein [Bifidobacterium xylocopae]
MTHYDDAQDVSMRPRGYGFEDHDEVRDRHLHIKALMERRKDHLIDLLQDPSLTPADRHRLEELKEEVKADIASVRAGGSDSAFQALHSRYR